jgi:hypothetical protein
MATHTTVPTCNTATNWVHLQGIHHTQDFGNNVGDKLVDIFRLAYGNINGFAAVQHTNPKANEL